jgi:arginine-tRNA-protein transferase
MAELNHAQRTARLALAIERSPLAPAPPEPCSYLPGRQAQHVFVLGPAGRPGLYHSFMDLNFRRSGAVFYRPMCEGCSACRAIRVPAESFAPDRSQRRCWRRNGDVTVSVARPEPDEEKHELYARYLRGRHRSGSMSGSWEEFCRFLHESPIDTREASFRVDGRLLAVSVFDVEPEALSAVYCYFDPAEQSRAPGVLNVLWLLTHARDLGMPWVYLGYWIAECPNMAYKARYRPCEVRGDDGVFRPL